MLHRAYSLIEIKAVTETDDERIIEGIATTPSTDRMGDIVEPLGAKFKLPMPLLWQHDAKAPVGQVEFAQPTKAGIPFKARIAKVDEPGVLKDRLDEAWQSLKAKLVRAVSIGFQVLAYEIMKEGGWRITEWEWLELSLVTIPANADATITSIKAIDTALRAASGQSQPGREASAARETRPGAAGVKATQPKESAVKTIAEQIAAFEATRAAKSAQMNTLMSDAAAKGETLDDAGAQEYDELQIELGKIDAHLKRLAALQAAQASAATPIVGVQSVEGASAARGGVVTVKGDNLPKGTAFTRYAIALARSKGNLMQAAEIAKGWHDTPQVETVLRAAVAAGTTTDSAWAAPLAEYTNMASEFVELLRPATIIGRLGGLRRVPFNIKMPTQTAGASVGWVGQGKPKPVTKLAFSSMTLGQAKAAGIIVLTDELVRASNPSAEAIVRQDMVEAIAQFLDVQFVDPDVAAVSDVNPASITNGVTPITASGTDEDDVDADVQAVFAAMIAAGLSIGGSTWIMTETMATALGMMKNALGQATYPDLGPNGGTFHKLPVITSQSTGLVDAGSPAGDRLILAKTSEILLADDGQVMLDASREASVEMESEPDDPVGASTVLISLWQHNMVGLRAERWINWKRRRAGAVQFIQGANYGGA